MQLAAGRRFSECLTSITGLTETSEGLFLVRGAGVFPQSSGEYELLVDVARGYLVREAKYNGGQVHVVTRGTVGQFPRTIAREGSLSYRGGGMTVAVSFNSMGRFSQKAHNAIEADADRLAELPFRHVIEQGKRRQYYEGRLRHTTEH